MKQKLASIASEELLARSESLSKNLNQLLSTLPIIQQNVLGGFAPIQKEPLWYLFLEEAHLRHLSFPSFENQQMLFRCSTFSELEVREDFGVTLRCPKLTAPPALPKVVLVPGLAFSKNGKRMGRGKGFYDRYLDNKDIIKIGLSFEIQLEENLEEVIPFDSHDIEMDYVVTELGIYKKS